MSFRLVPNSVTLDDLERNGRYCVISLNLVNLRCRKRSVAEFMQESIVFLVRVQCRRKESSRSPFHLLMSFLYQQASGSTVHTFTNFTTVRIRVTSDFLFAILNPTVMRTVLQCSNKPVISSLYGRINIQW